ncbi:hypothetical protein Xhom_01349 [Xenorhabdus hominickii]|uniref:Uncharacterized protein n=1 Tax=Xenorhabdus hominickii TaxID=351679 RepID=A0A2G0QGK1_XENHO|nr:hypothetical protein Xhom_01349 [Xenorhabdus hominickii]
MKQKKRRDKISPLRLVVIAIPLNLSFLVHSLIKILPCQLSFTLSLYLEYLAILPVLNRPCPIFLTELFPSYSLVVVLLWFLTEQ